MGALMATARCVDLCASCKDIMVKVLQAMSEVENPCSVEKNQENNALRLFNFIKKYSEALVLAINGNVKRFLLSMYQTLCIFW